jgi:hypothetical protein
MPRKKTRSQLDAEITEALLTSRQRGPRFTVPVAGPRGQVAAPAPGFVRLYRGGGGRLSDVTSPTHGQWFTTRLSSARDYVGADIDGPLPAGTVILAVDVHGADVARMPQTLIQATGYTPIPISEDDQAWLRSPKHLKEWGPPDVEVQVPIAVARTATRLQGSARDVSRAKPLLSKMKGQNSRR